MKNIIETERLILRELGADDARFVVEILNSPGWLKFIGDKNVKTEQDAIKYLENGPMKSYRENGFGLSLVERKHDSVAIGMCGIIKRPNLSGPDIGFALLPQFEGQGYAYEIASETIKHSKNELKINKIFAIALPENQRSIRLLDKLGMKFVERVRLDGDDEELVLYIS